MLGVWRYNFTKHKKNKMIELKRVGGEYGDKGNNQIQNLKLGEFRYYVQDNKNIIDGRILSKKLALKLMTCLFRGYHIDTSIEMVNGREILNIYGIGQIQNGQYLPIIINKGYVCIKEASLQSKGTILCIQDGFVIAYKESFI